MDAWLYSHRIQVALMLLPLHLKNIAFLKNGACCVEEGQADYDKNAEDTRSDSVTTVGGKGRCRKRQQTVPPSLQTPTTPHYNLRHRKTTTKGTQINATSIKD